MTESSPSSSLDRLDVSLFIHGTTAQRLQFSEDLLYCLQQYGFVKIVNHGISEQEITQLFKWSKRFFELSAEAKTNLVYCPGPYPQRGWSQVGSESAAKLYGALNAKGVKIDVTDHKEHFDMGGITDTDFPNRWPEDVQLAGYRTFLEHFYNACNRVSMHLLEALELSFGLPTEAFTSNCSQQAHELRLNHYPAVPRGTQSNDTNNRVWPHTDLGVITCLFQDDIGGLEVENPKLAGQYVAVVPGGRDEIIVNVAETLERWTNGRLKAGVHRVVPPRLSSTFEEDMVPQRYSSPFFVKADRQARVGSLPQFIKNNAQSQYADISALEYHTRRVAEAY